MQRARAAYAEGFKVEPGAVAGVTAEQMLRLLHGPFCAPPEAAEDIEGWSAYASAERARADTAVLVAHALAALLQQATGRCQVDNDASH